MTKEMIIERAEKIANANKAEGWHYTVKLNDWAKYGKDRTYITIVETRDNSKHYVSRDYGYYDNVADKYVAGKENLEGTLYTFSGARMED